MVNWSKDRARSLKKRARPESHDEQQQFRAASHFRESKYRKRKPSSPQWAGQSHMEFCHAWRFDESSRRRPGPIRRGLSFRHRSKGLFSTFDARDYGSRPSPGRPAESSYQVTPASTHGSI
jgi:hypothetical protein